MPKQDRKFIWDNFDIHSEIDIIIRTKDINLRVFALVVTGEGSFLCCGPLYENVA